MRLVFLSLLRRDDTQIMVRMLEALLLSTSCGRIDPGHHHVAYLPCLGRENKFERFAFCFCAMKIGLTAGGILTILRRNCHTAIQDT
jgi:hypothetical protein